MLGKTFQKHQKKRIKSNAVFKRKKEQLYPIGKEIPPKKTDNYRFLDSITVHALKTGRNRMMFLAYLFLLAFMVLGVRLFQQTILQQHIRTSKKSTLNMSLPVSRADIVDRNGRILATTIPFDDLYVDARHMPNPEKMADDLILIFPDMNKNDLLEKLKSKNSFKYLRRKLIPEETQAVNN